MKKIPFMLLAALFPVAVTAQIFGSATFDPTKLTLRLEGDSTTPKTIVIEENSNTQNASRKMEKTIPKIVREGYTWWYTCGRAFMYDEEFGVTIGPEVEDGWHKLIISKKWLKDIYRNIDWTLDDTPFEYDWVKEQDGVLWHRYFGIDDVTTSTFDAGPFGYIAAYVHEQPVDIKVLQFGEPGDTYQYGIEEDHLNVEIKNVGDWEFNGQTYRRYDVHATTDSEFGFVPQEDYSYLEGVGVVEPKSAHTFVPSLFYAPWGFCLTTISPVPSTPVLRYVTDENGEIFYTGAGGVKIWEEDPLGLTDVISGESAGKIFYDLQGVPVETPVRGQTYIEVTPSGARKVRL